jgi:hypothetical protein
MMASTKAESREQVLQQAQRGDMFENLREQGAHLVLLIFGIYTDQPGVWLLVLLLIAAISLVAWTSVYRRERLISDTPTSKVESAAQGYTELFGTARQHDGSAIVSELTQLPCVWYRYIVEEKRGKDWSVTDRGRSSETFVLDDGTGQCVIDPDGAEVMTSHRQTWTHETFRYTEWLLLQRDEIYALGEFATIGGANAELDFNGDLSALLAQWKADKQTLLKRYDLNHDGQIDEREWMLARADAKREINKRYREIRASSGVNVMRHPADGRLYLLSDLDARKLASRYRLWSIFHFIVMLGAGGAALYFAAKWHAVG